MIIYSSVFKFIIDYIEESQKPNPNYDSFLFCFIFCEFEEGFLFQVPKLKLVEIINQGCPELDLDDVYGNLDSMINLLTRMERYNYICYSKRLHFTFPWQPKAYYNTTWEQYEDFFFERIGIPVTFDHTQDPYFTLALQLKEVDVGFDLK